MGENERTFGILALCGIIGIILAIMLQLLYEQSIIIDSFVDTELTLRELQLASIVVWEMIGVGFVAITK
jgi:hypothetical protein